MRDSRIGAAPRFVGQSIGRKENARFLTGRGHYVDDFIVPGMLHAAFVRSPIARAKILSIDVSAALEVPGVFAVYTAKEMNGQFRKLTNIFGKEIDLGLDVVLAEDVVSFVGDPIAIVLADDRYIAEDALELIDIDYDPLEPVVTVEQARERGACLPGRDDNVAYKDSIAFPGAKEALAEAAHIVSGRIQQPRIAPTPIEARGIIVDPRMPGKLEIHMTVQNPHTIKNYIADMLKTNENYVRIIAPDVGGGFGQKYSCGRDYLATVGAARLAGRPVKWFEDRSEALVAGGHSRTECAMLDLAFDANGIMKATHFRVEQLCGTDTGAGGGEAQLAALMHTGAYNIPAVMIDIGIYFGNTCGRVAYRGPWAYETLVREITVDKAARKLGIDPVELRRRNIITQWPYTLPLGIAVDGVTPRECFDLLIEKLGYEAFRKEQAQARAEGRYLGLGLALCIEPTAMSETQPFETGRVRMDKSGKFTVVVTCTSQGHSIETTLAQVVADEMGVDIEDVRISYGDTDAIGYGFGAGGSRQAIVGGGAVKIASGKLREKIVQVAAHFLQTPADQLKLEGGRVVGPGASAPSMSLEEIGNVAYAALPDQAPDIEPGLAAEFTYAPPLFTFANAANACIVEVDIETGLVKILRYVVAEDCGVLLNPAVVEGQVAGGIIQGISNVLWETQQYDESGTPSAATLKDYALPLATDVPMIEFHHLCTPSNTPTGAKGVGEGGAIIGAPTCYNAVMDALSPFGIEMEELPLTPARIMAAVKAARG